MSVLVYIESEEGKFKKASLEVASYAKEVAQMLGTTVTAVTFNIEDISELGSYGIDKVLKINNSKLKDFNAEAYADALKQAAEKEASKVVVVSQSANSKYLAPLLAVHLNAGYASNVVALPESASPFVVKRTAFTNKAFNFTKIDTDVKILGVSKNAFGLKEAQGAAAAEDFSPSLSEEDFSVNVTNVDKAKDKVTIADAEIVVSGVGFHLK